MAITSYEKNGKTFWKVYINVRSKEDPSIREQKVVQGIESEKVAQAEERKLLRELSEKVAHLASQGLTWGAVIERWENHVRGENSYRQYVSTTVTDYVNCLNKWTVRWLDKPAAMLGRADGREVLASMEEAKKSRGYQKVIKHMTNVVYRWGMEERLIKGVTSSPVEGVAIHFDKAEKVPDILTIEEIRKLLQAAKTTEHPWYPVWAMALLTGMRNGELNSLLWSDIDLVNRKLTVSKSYNTRTRAVKCTKAGYWRTVPISDELETLLKGLRNGAQDTDPVLPHCWEWNKGLQAKVLKKFCMGIGIRPIKFHALRACFATQLLAHDVAPAQVMKVCGWRDLKTMQHYIRLAGVDERGATQSLRILPSDSAVMSEAVLAMNLKSVLTA